MASGDCCSSFLKFVMVLLNFVYFVFGLVTIAAALLCLTHGDQFVYRHGADGEQAAMAVLMLFATGGLTMMISMLGCCGAIRESSCMLATFMVIMVCLLIGQYRAGNEIWTGIAPLRELIPKQLSAALLEDYSTDGNSLANDYIDRLQQRLECCGINGPGDWAHARYNGMMGGHSDRAIADVGQFFGMYRVPPSCCVHGLDSRTCNAARQIEAMAVISGSIYGRGCLPVMYSYLDRFTIVVAGSLHNTVMGMQILSIVVSGFLYLIVRSADRSDQYYRGGNKYII